MRDIRKKIPQEIAESLCNVQPIDSNIIKKLYELSIKEKVLIEQGYKPISNDTRLLWIKDDQTHKR